MTLETRLRDALPSARIRVLRGCRFVVASDGRRVHLSARNGECAAECRVVLCVGGVALVELNSIASLRAVQVCVDWLHGDSMDQIRERFGNLKTLDGFDAWKNGDVAYLRWRWRMAIED